MSNSIKAISVFEASGPIDTNEGRGGSKSYGFYYQRDMATKVASDRGVWGTPGSVNMIHGYLVEIDGIAKFVNIKDLHDVFREPPEDVAARAMAKLTEEERIALGFKS